MASMVGRWRNWRADRLAYVVFFDTQSARKLRNWRFR
jgi:hypothetical protein